MHRVEKHVGRLEVSVDDIGVEAVQEGQPPRHVHRDPHPSSPRHQLHSLCQWKTYYY